MGCEQPLRRFLVILPFWILQQRALTSWVSFENIPLCSCLSLYEKKWTLEPKTKQKLLSPFTVTDFSNIDVSASYILEDTFSSIGNILLQAVTPNCTTLRYLTLESRVISNVAKTHTWIGALEKALPTGEFKRFGTFKRVRQLAGVAYECTSLRGLESIRTLAEIRHVKGLQVHARIWNLLRFHLTFIHFMPRLKWGNRPFHCPSLRMIQGDVQAVYAF